MHFILPLLLLLLALRFLYRNWVDFPAWPGRSPLEGTDASGLMDEDRFWALIEESRRRSNGNHDDQVDFLTDLLEGELPADIIAFQRAFNALVNKVNNFKYWESAYALNWGCSDDSFHYFCTWWIGQGRNKFYWSVRFPSLLFFFAAKESFQQYEGLEYCAGEAYENLTKRELPTDDFEYGQTRGRIFNESLAILKHPGLAFLAW